MKKCNLCKIELGNRNKSGLCRLCYNKRWNKQHKDKHYSYSKKWRAKNKEKLLTYQREWNKVHRKNCNRYWRNWVNKNNNRLVMKKHRTRTYWKHRAKILFKKQLHFIMNKDKHTAWRKRWRKANDDYYRLIAKVYEITVRSPEKRGIDKKSLERDINYLKEMIKYQKAKT